MRYEILTPGEKIKKIRKELNLNQEDISKGDITRNLISLIENGKANLTKNTAELVAQNINEICKNKNIDFKTTSDYLYEDVISQANKIADKYLEFVKNESIDLSLLEDTLTEIEDFLKSYDIEDKKCLIYFNIGEKLFNTNNKFKAYIYYVKAYENCTNLDNNDFNSYDIFRKLSICCEFLGYFKDSLKYTSIALNQIKNLSEHNKLVLKNNMALYLKKLKKYDESLKVIASVEKEFDIFLKEATRIKFKLLTLKGNCLMEQNHYTDALKIHKSMLKLIDKKDLEKTSIILCNITECYIKLNDTQNIKKYLNKNIKLLQDFKNVDTSVYAPQIYYSIGQAFEKLENSIEAKKYYELALYQCIHQKYISILENIFDRLLTIAINDNDLEYVNDLKNQFIELMSSKIISKTPNFLFKLINFYNELNEREKIKDIVSFLLNTVS